MANPTYNCNANTLLIASSCFINPAMGHDMRLAIELYARVGNLMASGGTNYVGNLQKLKDDAATNQWINLACNQREAIATYRTVQDALADGATFASDINSLSKAAKCYLALGIEDKKNVLAYLACALSALGKPD
jgi:hypothetical protein